MISRVIFFGLISLLVFFTLYHFIFSESYQKSIRAKAYYSFGEYKEAYKLSKEAFELDAYNKMAFTVMGQSRINLKFLEFIEMANGYKNDIQKMVEDGASSEEKIKIKIICEVVMGKYKEVNGETRMTDKELLKTSQELYDWFGRIYKEAYGR